MFDNFETAAEIYSLRMEEIEDVVIRYAYSNDRDVESNINPEEVLDY